VGILAPSRSIRVRLANGNAFALALPAEPNGHINLKEHPIMGKYFLDWIMGVPVVLLIITYFILN
jgi:hypothetical protein